MTRQDLIVLAVLSTLLVGAALAQLSLLLSGAYVCLVLTFLYLFGVGVVEWHE